MGNVSPPPSRSGSLDLTATATPIPRSGGRRRGSAASVERPRPRRASTSSRRPSDTPQHRSRQWSTPGSGELALRADRLAVAHQRLTRACVATGPSRGRGERKGAEDHAGDPGDDGTSAVSGIEAGSASGRLGAAPLSETGPLVLPESAAERALLAASRTASEGAAGTRGQPLRTGNRIVLRAAHDTGVLASAGFEAPNCVVADVDDKEVDAGPEASRSMGHLTAVDGVFEIVSSVDRRPDPLYRSPTGGASDSHPRVDLNLQKMSQWPRMLALRLERQGIRDVRQKTLQALLTEAMLFEPRINSMAIAFEPNRFYMHDEGPPQKHYCRFAERATTTSADDRGETGVVFNDLLPPKYEPLYTQWPWYTEPKKRGAAVWSDPYIDTGGAETPMVTYSVPVRDEGVFVGVVTMDVVLDSASLTNVETPADDATAGDEESATSDSLDRIVKGPQEIARVLSAVEDDELSDDLIKAELRKVMLDPDNAQVFGMCVAFAEGVWFGETEHNVYVCRDVQGEASAPVPAGAAASSGQDSDSSGEHAPSEAEHKSEGLRWEPLDYSYLTDEWYAVPAKQRRDNWSAPYFDEGGADKWVVTYSVPFRRHGKLAGVCTLDLDLHDGKTMQSEFTEDRGQSKGPLCALSRLPCGLAAWRTTALVEETWVSDRCFNAGLLPPELRAADLERYADRKYRDWWSANRRPGRKLRYGQYVQLLHVGVQQFLCVRLSGGAGDVADGDAGAAGDDGKLKSKSTRSWESGASNGPGGASGVYRLTLDMGRADPYHEGSEDSWFILESSNGSRLAGEEVLCGDDVRLVSARWAWTVELPPVPAPAGARGAQGISNAFEEALARGQLVLREPVKTWRLALFAGLGDAPSLLSSSPSALLMEPPAEEETGRSPVHAGDEDEQDGAPDRDDDCSWGTVRGGMVARLHALRGRTMRLANGDPGIGLPVLACDTQVHLGDQGLVGRDRVYAKRFGRARGASAGEPQESGGSSAAGDDAVAHQGGNAVWEVQLADTRGPVTARRPGGSAVRFGDCFRLRHVSTGRYLSVAPQALGPLLAAAQLVQGDAETQEIAPGAAFEEVLKRMTAGDAVFDDASVLPASLADPDDLLSQDVGLLPAAVAAVTVPDRDDAALFRCTSAEALANSEAAKLSNDEMVDLDGGADVPAGEGVALCCCLPPTVVAAVNNAAIVSRRYARRLERAGSDGSADGDSISRVVAARTVASIVARTAAEANTRWWWMGLASAAHSAVRCVGGSGSKMVAVMPPEVSKAARDDVSSMWFWANASSAQRFAVLPVAQNRDIDLQRILPLVTQLQSYVRDVHSISRTAKRSDDVVTERRLGLREVAHALAPEDGPSGDDGPADEAGSAASGEPEVEARSAQVLDSWHKIARFWLHRTRARRRAVPWPHCAEVVIDYASDAPSARSWSLELTPVIRVQLFGELDKQLTFVKASITMLLAFVHGDVGGESVPSFADTIWRGDRIGPHRATNVSVAVDASGHVAGDDVAEASSAGATAVVSAAGGGATESKDGAADDAARLDTLPGGRKPARSPGALSLQGARRPSQLRQVLLREGRCVETCVEVLRLSHELFQSCADSALRALQTDDEGAVSFADAAIKSMLHGAEVCLLALQLLRALTYASQNGASKVVAAQALPHLLHYVCRQTHHDVVSDSSSMIGQAKARVLEQRLRAEAQLRRLANSLLQAMLNANRSLLLQITPQELVALCKAALAAPALPARLVLVISALVARPATSQRDTSQDMHFHDGGEGLVPFPRNQMIVIEHFLLGNDGAFLRAVIGPRSRFWATQGVRGSDTTFASDAAVMKIKVGFNSAEAVVKLCVRLCLGRAGGAARHALQQVAGVDFDWCMHVLGSEGETHRLRAAVCDLIRVMFVQPTVLGSATALNGAAGVGCGELGGDLVRGPNGEEASGEDDDSGTMVPRVLVSWPALRREVPYGMGAVSIEVAASHAGVGAKPYHIPIGQRMSASQLAEYLEHPEAYHTGTHWDSSEAPEDDPSVPHNTLLCDETALPLERDEASAMDVARGLLADARSASSRMELYEDARLPVISVDRAVTLRDVISEYLSGCIQLAKNNSLTLSMLRLARALVHCGAWSSPRVLYSGEVVSVVGSTATVRETGTDDLKSVPLQLLQSTSAARNSSDVTRFQAGQSVEVLAERGWLVAPLLPHAIAIIETDQRQSSIARMSDDEWELHQEIFNQCKRAASVLLELVSTQVGLSRVLELYRCAHASAASSATGPVGSIGLLAEWKSAFLEALASPTGHVQQALVHSMNTWLDDLSHTRLGMEDALYRVLRDGTWSPMLLRAAQVLLRRHCRHVDVVRIMRAACVLWDRREHAFACDAWDLTQRLASLTLWERTCSSPAEIDADRATEISASAQTLLRGLRNLLEGAHGRGIARSRAQAIYRALGVSRLATQLVYLPLQFSLKDTVAIGGRAKIASMRRASLSVVASVRAKSNRELEAVRAARVRIALTPVLRSAYALLASVARHNAAVCRELASHINHFLGHSGLRLHASRLVSELVRGNEDACKAIDASHIERAIEKLADSSPGQRIRHLLFLRSVSVLSETADETILVDANQMLVVRGLCEDSTALRLLGRLDHPRSLQRFVDLVDRIMPRKSKRGAPGLGASAVPAVPGRLALSHSISESTTSTEGGGDDDDSESDDDGTNFFGDDETELRRLVRDEAQYYVTLLQLMTSCAPSRLVYRAGMAVRQAEEAAMLCRAALPLRYLVTALRSVHNSAMKSALLRFIERVHGYAALASGAHHSFHASELFNPVTAAPAALEHSSTPLTPVQSILLDIAHAIDAFGTASEMSTFPVAGGVSVSDSELLAIASCRDVVQTQQAATLSPGMAQLGLATYVFGAGLPFLVGYFHSEFRQNEVDERTTAMANALFGRVYALGCGLLEPPKRSSSPRRWVWIDAVINCLMHMHDSEGTLRCTGVSNGMSDDEVQDLVSQLRERRVAVLWPQAGVIGGGVDEDEDVGGRDSGSLRQRASKLWSRLRDNVHDVAKSTSTQVGRRSRSRSAARRFEPIQLRNQAVAFVVSRLFKFIDGYMKNRSLSSRSSGDGSKDRSSSRRERCLVDSEFAELCSKFFSKDKEATTSSAERERTLAKLILLMTQLSGTRSSSNSSGLRGADAGGQGTRLAAPNAIFGSMQGKQELLGAYLRLLTRIAKGRDRSSDRRDAQSKLVSAGVPRLVVRLIDANWLSLAGNKAAPFGGFGSSDLSSRVNRVLKLSIRLANELLLGGYRPAQDALLSHVRMSAGSGDVLFLRQLKRLLSSTKLVVRTKAEIASELAQSGAQLTPVADTGADAGEEQSGSALAAAKLAKQARQKQYENVDVVLSLVQQLCEGHNRQWQDLLRTQRWLSVQVDVVTEVGRLISRLVQSLSVVVMHWDQWFEMSTIDSAGKCLLQAFATCTEVMQGPCPGNQVALARSDVLIAINSIWKVCSHAYGEINRLEREDGQPDDDGAEEVKDGEAGDSDDLQRALEEEFSRGRQKDSGRASPVAGVAATAGGASPKSTDAGSGSDAAAASDGGSDSTSLASDAAEDSGHDSDAGHSSEGDVHSDGGDSDASSWSDNSSLSTLSSGGTVSASVEALTSEESKVQRTEAEERKYQLAQRRAFLRKLQFAVLETLCAMIEGAEPGSRTGRIHSPAAGSMCQRLEFARINDLLSPRKTAAEEESGAIRGLLDEVEHARTLETPLEALSLENVGERLSEGDWGGQYASEDLCAQYLIFIRYLAHCCGISAKLDPLEATPPTLRSFLLSDAVQRLRDISADDIAAVEVVRDDTLEPLLFRLPYVVRQESHSVEFEEAKKHLINTVSRDNPYAKIDDYARMSPKLASILLANPIQRQQRLVRWLPWLLEATWVLAIVLNVLHVVTSSNDVRSSWPNTAELLDNLQRPICVVHSVLSVLRLLSLYLSTWPLLVSDKDWSGGGDDDDDDDPGILPKIGGVLAAPILKLVRWMSGQAMAENVMLFLSWASGDPNAVFTLVYTTLSVTASVTDFESLLAVHLFDIIPRSTLLRDTLAALRNYSNSLAATGVLWVILMYVFALLGHARFADHFPENECDDPLSCVLFTLNFGMRAGGGLGDVLAGGDGASHGGERLLFDTAYFAVVTVVMLSTVTGIIIDAFNAQRDHNNDVEENQEGMCFICSLPASQFERHSHGFKYHIKHEHNMWAFAFLRAYLSLKDETSYTGLESYIMSRSDSLDVYPVQRATLWNDMDGDGKVDVE